MKEKLSLFFFLWLLIAAAAILPLYNFSNDSGSRPPSKQTEFNVSEVLSADENVYEIMPSDTVPNTQDSQSIIYENFWILDESSGQILIVSNNDFLPGAIAVEMPLTYPDEALKAQAVAAYTYYSRLRQQNRESKNPSNFDFSANIQNWSVYVTPEQMKERWGAEFETYYDKLQHIASSVQGQALYYQGELALCVYHAISSGKTEASADVWGGAYDYLIPVDSLGDISADGYLSNVSVTTEQIKAAAEKKWPDCDLSSSPEKWFGNIQRTPSGSVESILLGGIEVSGADIRTAFELRSSNFDVTFQNGQFCFTVRGYGHGVGMSQNGAAYLASSGFSYMDILQHYYPGTSLFSN